MDIRNLIENSLARGQKALSEHDAKRVLDAAGIPVVAESVAETPEAAAQKAGEIGFPVVLKGLGSRLMHKTEKGLVHLNLKNKADVLAAAEKTAAAGGHELEGFLVQPFVDGKREWVAGMFRDNQFGPVIMFGTGGVFTEALADVVFRLAPLSDQDAVDMLAEIKTQALLGQFRGEHGVDEVEVRWSSGLIQTIKPEGVNRIITVIEGEN